MIQTDNWQEALVKELANKYNLGSMQPEGDGWHWDFEPSESGRNALREAISRTLEKAAEVTTLDDGCECPKCEALRQLMEPGKERQHADQPN